MANFILSAYKRLYRRFGPQGWWPTTPKNSDHPVYTPRQSLLRLTETERFEICLGTFLTQNTSWSNAMTVLALLKKRGLLRFEKLVQLPLPKMQVCFRSSGYFRQKSFRVKNFLKRVQNETDGRFRSFFSGTLANVRKKLLSISGVGPETADSMLLYAAGRPSFVVDAYTRRIGKRWGILRGSETYDENQKIFMTALPRSPRIFGEYHALLVKLAKDFCREKPMCFKCPMKNACETGKHQEEKR